MMEDPTRNYFNILDIVLTSHPFYISSLEVIEPFSTSDHNSIVFSVDTGLKCHYDVYDTGTVHNSYDWKRADYMRPLTICHRLTGTTLCPPT